MREKKAIEGAFRKRGRRKETWNRELTEKEKGIGEESSKDRRN